MASTVDETFRELAERVQFLEAENESLRKQLGEQEVVIQSAMGWADHPETPRSPQDIPLYDAVIALTTAKQSTGREMTTKREALEQALVGIRERTSILNEEINERIEQRKALDEFRLETMRLINEALTEEIASAQGSKSS